MKVDLGIAAWSLAGPGADAAPAARRCDLPPPGTRRKGGRAPLLAVDLARRCLDDGVDTADAAVLFGTALGCLTETEAFVTHMIAAEEATPKPRAFAASVHNAIASKVALELGARGECQTFAHGEVSFAHALWAAARVRARAGSATPILCGAIDEDSAFVHRGLAHCAPEVADSVEEGGAVLRLAARASVHVEHVAFGRPADPVAWLEVEITDPGTVVCVPDLSGQHAGAAPAPFDTRHGALLATACALAAGVLEGSVAPGALGIRGDAGRRLTLLGRSRLGDCAAVTLGARIDP